MKKIFTLVAVALAAISANAQIETGFINEEVVGWNVDAEGKKNSKTTSIDPDVELASSDNVTMYNAYKCDYKLVSITAEADVANQVSIDGETIDLSANGAPSCLEKVVVQKKDADGNKLWEAADGGDPVTDETLAKKDGNGKSIPFGDHFTSLKQLYQLLPTDNFKTGNALSIIAIPVRKNLTYYVNACGSKISTNGYAIHTC